jgi:YD repeat-containing protein
VVNQGTLEGDGPGQGLTVNSAAARNSGTWEAVNGGYVELGPNTAVDNTGGLLTAASASFIYNFGTVTGGTLVLPDTGTLVNGNSAYPATVTGSSFELTAGANIQGNGTLDNPTVPASANVNLNNVTGQTIAGTVTDYGMLSANAGTASLGSASLEVDNSGILAFAPAATVTLAGSLLGGTTNASQFSAQGTLLFDGSGTSTAPQVLEAMSQDLGNVTTGLRNNFAYGTLALGNNTYVQLVDNAVNSVGSTGPEALYANTVVVPAGCTLDLNGLHVYARVVQVGGAVLNSTVQRLPAGGPLIFNTPAAGDIQTGGAVDNWTFYGRANQTVAIVVNTGSQGTIPPQPPPLGYAQAQLLDPNGNVVASASNTQAGTDVMLLGVPLPVDGTYTVQVQAPASQPGSTGDYLITTWDAPVHNNPLNPDQPVNGQLATPYAQDHWTFSAVAGEQVQFNLLNASSSAVLFDLTGPGGYAAFTNATASSGLIDLPTSGTYTLTAHASTQAGSYAFRLQETTVTPLSVNTSYQGTLTGSGQAQLFTVALANPTALAVALTDLNANDQNEVYVSLGSAPTRDTYQYRYSGIGSNQSVVLPAQAGTYYILVYDALATTPGGQFTLDVQSGAFVLSGLTPGDIGNSQPSTLLATGVFPLAYQAAKIYQIQFVSAGGTIYPASPLYLEPTALSPRQVHDGGMTMSATLPADALPAGTYTVTISDGLGDSQTLQNALKVTVGGTGVLKTSISAPNPMGNHQPSTVYVQYTNIGTAPMAAPLLVLTATRNGQQGAFLTLDPALAGLGYGSNTVPAGFAETVQFLASGAVPGVLEPGESETVPVYYGGWLTSGWGPPIVFTLGELDTTNTQPIDWPSIQAGLQPGSINAAAWAAISPIVTAALGTTWGQYVQTLDNDAVYLAGIGQPTNDLSQLLSFEIEKANAAYTAQTLVSVTADSLPAPGMDLTFVQSYQQSISGRYTPGILGLGWTTNWDISAIPMPNGDVVVKNDGISLYFSLQPNGTFTPEAGDQGTALAAGASGYTLTQPDGTVYQFNPNGTLNFIQDAHGNSITAGYNPQLPTQLVSLTDSNGEYIDLAYNAQGLLSQLTDSNGQSETYGYDPTGQFLTSYTDLYGTTQYSYVTGQSPAQDNALAEVAYADNTHIYFGYDAQGRLVDQHRDGGQEDQAWTYLNPGGYVATDANGNQTTVYFNLFGATAETIDPLGNVTRNYYDSNLNLTRVIGPGGATYQYTYDQSGNLLSQTDPLGLTTQFTYDNRSNLLSYTDAKGNTTRYAYSPQNDLMSITYANGTAQAYQYNPLGEATQYLNARGQAIGYTYNPQGLVATETFADGTSFAYAYSPQGNLTSATDAQGNVTQFIYGDTSNPDLLTEVQYPDGTWLKFSYNVVGQRTQSVDQTGFTVNYSYDALGRLSELDDGGGNLIVHYTYDAAGNLVQKDMGNGTRTAYTYDGDGNVLTITNYAPDHVTVNSFDDYTYDPQGNVLTDTNQDGQWQYTYDADSQLTAAVFTPNSTNPDGLTAQNLQYVYDAAGNRQSETVNGVTTTYVVNNVNAYTSSTTNGVTTAYQYDADGNLIAQTTGGSTTSYRFNQLNELTGVSSPAVTAAYLYDPLGNRVSQSVNGLATRFQVDPAGFGNIVASFSANGLSPRTSRTAPAWSARSPRPGGQGSTILTTSAPL